MLRGVLRWGSAPSAAGPLAGGPVLVVRLHVRLPAVPAVTAMTTVTAMPTVSATIAVLVVLVVLVVR